MPLPLEQFAHRANDDGTVDSICRMCFATVARTHWEADLETAERMHICNPEELEHFTHPRRVQDTL
jgi:hypothetical protein